MTTKKEHPAIVASKALEEFNKAMTTPTLFAGKPIAFNDTICVTAMDLFADIRGELEFNQFGEEGRRDNIAESIVAVIFRNEDQRR
jgi:hypothetical protein